MGDDVKSAIIKLADGNPGAITVMMHMLRISESVDPDAAIGAIAPIFSLDSLGIYGSRIWMLYKDFCQENTVVTLAVLRAAQLGILPLNKLNHAIDNYGDGVDLSLIAGKVKERLPNFGKIPQENSDELLVIKDAILKHKLKIDITEDALALVRYALHVGYNQGFKDGTKS
jgi:hypothetical protein